MEEYLLGCDCQGADGDMADVREEIVGDIDILGAANLQGPFLTVHVKNVAQVVAKEAGAAGSMAFGLVPQTVENTFYSRLVAEFGKGLKEKGVDADIRVVSNLPAVGGSPKDLLVGTAIGASVIGLVIGLVKLFKK